MENRNTAETIVLTGKDLRRAHKRRGWDTLRSHYFILIFLFIVTVFFGTQSTGLGNILRARNLNKVLETTGAAFRMDTSDISSFKFLDTVDKIISGDSGTDSPEKNDNVPSFLDFSSSKGILAGILTRLSSGKLSALVTETISRLTKSRNTAVLIQMILSALIQILIWIFFFNVIDTCLTRVFLTARTYPHVDISTMLHFLTVRRWPRVSATMLLTFIFQTLWNLTIIGGFIKHFSYYMVPYIVAENPDIRPLEAITLSRRMMNGHKWECFVYQLSFFPWMIFGLLTLGIGEIFFTKPYMLCTMAEYYAHLRSLAKENKLENADMLNDEALFTIPSADMLETVYSDIQEQNEYIEKEEKNLRGARGFVARNFGIWISSAASEKKYHEVEVRKFRIRSEKLVLKGESYPLRLNSAYTRYQKDIHFTEGATYLKAYSISSIILMFFSFCAIGWLWEVSLFMIQGGSFANRGTLHGPWLPIYGAGGLIMLCVLKRFRDRPFLLSILMLLIAGGLEYFASWIIEKTTGLQYWDYSGYFLNLNGRICAEGLIVFVLAGLLVVYLIAPFLDSLFIKIPRKIVYIICAILLTAFTVDLIYSKIAPNTGNGITENFEGTEKAAADAAADTTADITMDVTAYNAPDAAAFITAYFSPEPAVNL
ncbi:MAG: DUF975 family protein [Eubacterium sp.]|nr:DUF975 family protein [Eubacterium sp.]